MLSVNNKHFSIFHTSEECLMRDLIGYSHFPIFPSARCLTNCVTTIIVLGDFILELGYEYEIE